MLVVAPMSVSAFEMTSQSATKINQDTALFLINFDLGFLNSDSWLSSTVSQSASSSASIPMLNYIVEGGYNADDFTATAMVLSKAPLSKDNYYYVPQGKREDFILVVLLQKKDKSNTTVNPTSIRVNNIVNQIKLNNKTTLRNFGPELLINHKTTPLTW
jgi:hypothetical protein